MNYLKVYQITFEISSLIKMLCELEREEPAFNKIQLQIEQLTIELKKYI